MTAPTATRIFVTGASGFLGRQICADLVARPGNDVHAGSRDGTAAPAGAMPIAHGDLIEPLDRTALLHGIDVVVHCAARAHVLREVHNDPLRAFMAANCAATLALAHQAADAGVKRFIFISSIGVLGNQTFGQPFTASDAPAPNSPYAVSKLKAEEGLTAIARDTGLEVVILRPPLILGPDPVGNLGTLARFIGRGIPLPFGLATKNRRSLVSAHNVAGLIATCLTHPKAPGGVFLVADAAPLHTRGILEALAHLTNQRLRLLPVPVFILRAALRALGRSGMDAQLFSDLEVDISATTQQLGWSPYSPSDRLN
jgi:nucleoside-diphosphate-sugar epimerase